ncbi:MAG: hypothetical protein CMJ72_07085 [Planctomycetaceae bacterium]|nr:hypothetical protein [Planctomycetaceae bacterium]HCK42773.1 hypothetical protein [Planctomycetaceae bacterium]
MMMCQNRQFEERIKLLTNREKQITERLAVGISSKSIAKRLGISSKTVDNHRANILEKMVLDNAAQLARLFASIQTARSS